MHSCDMLTLELAVLLRHSSVTSHLFLQPNLSFSCSFLNVQGLLVFLLFLVISSISHAWKRFLANIFKDLLCNISF